MHHPRLRLVRLEGFFPSSLLVSGHTQPNKEQKDVSTPEPFPTTVRWHRGSAQVLTTDSSQAVHLFNCLRRLIDDDGTGRPCIDGQAIGARTSSSSYVCRRDGFVCGGPQQVTSHQLRVFNPLTREQAICEPFSQSLFLRWNYRLRYSTGRVGGKLPEAVDSRHGGDSVYAVKE